MDFQNVNPELFILVGELLGDVIANELPFNVQNAVGNWLQLVGQAILTYNAQQQYYQQGPGRCFTPDSFNVDNPFTQSNESSSSSSGDDDKEILPKSSRSASDKKDSSSAEDTLKMTQLQETVEKLTARMEQLENELKHLRGSQPHE